MDTTVEIANKVGAAEIVSRVVEDLKDEAEQYRKMVMDCIEKVGRLPVINPGNGFSMYLGVGQLPVIHSGLAIKTNVNVYYWS